MKALQTLALTAVFLAVLAIGAVGASASSLLQHTSIGNNAGPDAASGARSGLILVDRGAALPDKPRAGNIYKRPHPWTGNQAQPRIKKHHRVHRPSGRRLKKHRRANRHYRKRRNNSGIYFGIYPYYNPYYGNSYYDDPYYSPPTYYRPRPVDRRLSCARVRNKLRNRGYHRVRAYDCKGKVYVFYARSGGKNYRIRVNAYSGKVNSRHRL